MRGELAHAAGDGPLLREMGLRAKIEEEDETFFLFFLEAVFDIIFIQ